MPFTKPSTIGILPRSLQQLLAEVVQKIVNAVQPEKIICYGLRSVHYQDWGCFLNEGTMRDTSRLKLDLLIIAPVIRGQLEQDISFAAEQQCKSLADVHCITHKIHSVNENLTKGSPFFCTLYSKSLLVYDSGQTNLRNSCRYGRTYGRKIYYTSHLGSVVRTGPAFL